jgi:RsiW-degrading membrane proteinase PrsW (M82 family)
VGAFVTEVSSGHSGGPLPEAPAAPPLEPATIPRHLWLIALVVGAVAWVAGAVATAITDDTILVPNIIILGTFLVPVCTVLFVLSRPREAHLRAETLMLGFLAGGTAGIVLTAVTEVYLLPDAVGTNAGVGLIEEGGKGLILLAVATLVRPRVPRDGMVLGATVGAGFAAFESAGYALRVLIDHADDHPVLNIIQTEAFRAVLAPFGHITWTAIFGGALFASAWATGRFRVDRRVALTFLGVAALHALWDASTGWAIPRQRGTRRRGMDARLARHVRLGGHADGRRPDALPGRLRRDARDRRDDRARLGLPQLARVPDRSLALGARAAGGHRSGHARARSRRPLGAARGA